MRMMMKISMPVEKSNQAVNDGSLPKLIESTLAQIKPEAAYFYGDNGERTALIVFDMKDSSQMPPLSEPFFQGVNAKISMTPVMNAADLRSGLEQWSKK